MILQIRGAMGSGKTTLMRSIMERRLVDLVPQPNKAKPRSKRPEAYVGTTRGGLDERHSVAVLGPYGDAACGGMDAVNSVDASLELIHRYARQCEIVLYEGMMLGHIYGRHGAAMIEHYPDRHHFIFLTTPLDVCIERVRQRRAARGATTTTFDPKNVIQSFDTVASSRTRIAANGGRGYGVSCEAADRKIAQLTRSYFNAR